MEKETIEKYLRAGEIGKEALQLASTLIEPGSKLFDVAEQVEGYIRKNGAEPAFPLNLSINNEAAHYTPFYGDKKAFRTGDVVKVDIGAHVDGYMSDNAMTVEVGGKGEYSDLIDSTREALNNAISITRPGQKLREIGKMIEKTIMSHGYQPVRNLGGHGIDRYDLHSSIFIPNYDDKNEKTLSPGIAIAIEPFASTGVGLIHDSGGGNIYILSGTKPRQDEIIYRNFRTAPFAERWLHGKVDNPDTYLRGMIRSREVSQFAVLKEHKGACVAQSEHTLLVLPDKIMVTTL